MADTYLPEGMPLPGYDPGSPDADFWEACGRHELVVQRCTDCKTFQHTPRDNLSQLPLLQLRVRQN